MNDTIGKCTEGHEKRFLEYEETAQWLCRKLAADRLLLDCLDEYNYPDNKGITDECSRFLNASTMKSRKYFAIVRLMNAMLPAPSDAWLIVFYSLLYTADLLVSFCYNSNAFR